MNAMEKLAEETAQKAWQNGPVGCDTAIILSALNQAVQMEREVTDKMVSVALQTFRREMNIRMDTKHPSASPGHESMRLALVAIRNLKEGK